jgi:hypothetical protein
MLAVDEVHNRRGILDTVTDTEPVLMVSKVGHR